MPRWQNGFNALVLSPVWILHWFGEPAVLAPVGSNPTLGVIGIDDEVRYHGGLPSPSREFKSPSVHWARSLAWSKHHPDSLSCLFAEKGTHRWPR